MSTNDTIYEQMIGDPVSHQNGETEMTHDWTRNTVNTAPLYTGIDDDTAGYPSGDQLWHLICEMIEPIPQMGSELRAAAIGCANGIGKQGFPLIAAWSIESNDEGTDDWVVSFIALAMVEDGRLFVAKYHVDPTDYDLDDARAFNHKWREKNEFQKIEFLLLIDPEFVHEVITKEAAKPEMVEKHFARFQPKAEKTA